MTLLVTGFGPFRGFDENPSHHLAEWAKEFAPPGVRLFMHTIPVDYEVAKVVIANIKAQKLGTGFRWLMLGVSPKATKFRIERVARNVVGNREDANGKESKAGPIARGREIIRGNWFGDWNDENEMWEPSDNAGNYLCNYLYFLAQHNMPKLSSGFVHVPPFETVGFDTQSQWMRELLNRLCR